ncbi:cysteine hydrolase family protein [Euzebya tangerina]|uniref:cysteine hydrolase family protein n=1 Tax=Euzebya tangerina TaxID=591198 RepID=UPI000E31D8BB|nr:isochorismatase family cysteine hydrolase [Euzebya tangerina]
MTRWWEWEEAFPIEPDGTALLVVDMQQGFIEPGSVLEVPMAREQIPVIQALIEGFRERGMPVAYTRFVAREDHFLPFYRSRAPQRGLDLAAPRSMFAPDSDDAKIDERLAPREGEIVVDKIAYDGFHQTELDDRLRSRGIDTLVHCGTVVNWCVDSTLRAAFHRRYQNVVVADGVSGYEHAGASGEDWVARELDFFAEALATVLRAEDVLAELGASET